MSMASKNGKADACMNFPEEAEMFSFLGLPVVPPEIREDWGEVELALENRLPVLVSRADIKGDLHVHSDWSDGFLSLAELAEAGEERGYEYLLCSDHSVTLGIAHGLDTERLKKQAQEIEQVNRGSTCTILRGVEVDILSDGSLGLPNHVLADLDLVVASIHSGFNEDRDIMTRRVITALENEHVDIIGHPTGRLLGRRLPFELDVGRVIERAAETGTALECNASPIRLDLDDVNIKQAVERHVKIAVNTDAHHRGGVRKYAVRNHDREARVVHEERCHQRLVDERTPGVGLFMIYWLYEKLLLRQIRILPEHICFMLTRPGHG